MGGMERGGEKITMFVITLSGKRLLGPNRAHLK